MPAKKKSSKTDTPTTQATPTESATPFKFNVDATPEGIKTSITNHLKYTLARDPVTATKRDWWISTCHAVHDRILERFIQTMGVHNEKNVRRVYYLSLEYLMGRLMMSNIINAGLYDAAEKALADLGYDLREMANEEEDMGLGNGGLGRLAACFLDSLATLELPAVGYGIRYEYGLFRQEFVQGRQVERPDNWLKFGNPWEIIRPEYSKTVRLYGRVETVFTEQGDPVPTWVDTKSIVGVPYDVPICGYGAKTVNFLRLWESRASEEFDLATFNRGGYVEAVREKAVGETISKVLYPNDTTESGKELRLVQQYFFVSCSLQDILRRFLKKNESWDAFPEKIAIQLNDTHPAIAVAECMRILVDDAHLDWDKAWDITQRTLAYTNHTLLPEALEKWSVPLFEKVLPRHLQLIYEINRRFLENVVEAKWPGDNSKKRDLSIIEEGHPKKIRMAYLSVIGSHATNGVAALHTDLLKSKLMPDFNTLFPERFQNKTNGITPRRWLKLCNPLLSNLITKTLGYDTWAADIGKLVALEKHADNKAFQTEFMAIKRANKAALAEIIHEELGISVSADALFDVQIKRLHEYKRQHLNLLHILTLYRRILHDPNFDMVPRVFIFGAKAAPGYDLAKCIIHAINAVAHKINHDPRVGDKLKVVFLPNYSVSLAEHIIPASDLSEQISTAGKEASGTGNMKLALNGSLTIGTLDGANVEIREEVGDENIFIFGLTVPEVEALWSRGYNPFDYYYANEELRAIVDWIGSSYFTPEDPHALQSIRNSLLHGGDPFLVLADYAAYCEAQHTVDQAYRDKSRWAKMAILNTARVGKFSSDRTIAEYAKDIWSLPSVPIA